MSREAISKHLQGYKCHHRSTFSFNEVIALMLRNLLQEGFLTEEQINDLRKRNVKFVMGYGHDGSQMLEILE